MRRRGLTAAAACVLVACASQAGAAPVADGKIVGRVATALRPASGSQTVVQAIDASNITVAASGRVTRAGTYKLAVPPGIFLVAAEKIGRRTAAARGFSRLVRVRGGASVSPPRITRKPQSVTGTLVGGRPALAVKEFSSTPSGLHGGNLARMLTTDLSIARGPCVVIVDWIRRADILAEIRLQQSTAVDPSTRVTPRLTQPTIFVEGSVSTTDSSISWNIRMREIRSGRIVARDSGSVPLSRYLDVSRDIAKRLLEQLDADCLPQRIQGSFSGDLKQAGRTTFSGTVQFDRVEPSPQGTATYRVSRVQFTTTIDTRPACQGSGTENVTLTNVDQTLARLVIDTHKVAGKGYRYFIVGHFQSPRQRQITVTCNGSTTTIPWVPFAALSTGSNHHTDGVAFKGTNNELVGNTYNWDLRAAD